MVEVDYPFVIGNKVIKVTAPTLSNALDRITSRYQNKFITITHAKNMDLISAKVEAAKQSRAEHRKVYIIVDDEGECSINNAPLKGVLHCYNNGSEIALENDAPTTDVMPRASKNIKPKKNIPAQSEKAQILIAKKETTKTESKMATPKKKAAKKVAAKKTESKPVGKLVTMIVKEVVKAVKAGKKAFNEAGKPLPEGYIAKMKDQSREIKVTLV